MLTYIGFLSLLGACSKLCQSGYEGKDCNTLSTGRFTGKWAITDTPDSLMFTDSITGGSGISDIDIYTAFAGKQFTNPIYGSVVTGKVTVNSQQPDTAQKYWVAGYGNINSNNDLITWTYQLTDSTDSPVVINTYTGLWTRQ
ncbi:MAG TPA: hypothetical protein VG603_02670 [Chitinophagales bacterium]|nr:hypothetical protein [Chitinophagales bacterium]